MITAGTPRIIDPKLLTAATKGPVDAVVFYKAPENDVTRQAASKFSAIEAMPLGTERKTAAYEALHTLGTQTLAAHHDDLQALVAAGKATAVDELWSLGAVRVRGANLDTIKSLVGPGVQAIMQDTIVAAPAVPAATEAAVEGAVLTPLPANFDRETGAAEARATDEDPNAVWMDWGVKRMHAPDAWKQGITGAGVVIGSLDTGVYVDHPNLTRNYRGHKADGTVDNDYNWKDMVKELPEDGVLPDGTKFDDKDKAPNGTSLRPIDLNGHGTHTSGSALGWSPQHITGVAPDAKLIVSRGLGEKGGSMFDLVAAMEWFMAPTKVDGTAPRPDLAPDIVTNSWGGAPMGNPFLWMALRNWRRAGIIPVFAAGNNREAKPGEVAVPGMYPETITVGASDLDDARAWFSMYGPSDYANGHKPEVMAPGHWTYSSLPDGTTRDTFPVKMPDGSTRLAPASGTSMATPHVAGAMALYIQAHPNATFDDVLNALKGSGNLADKPNEEQGWGIVQVDKLIAPGTIAKDAVLTDKARVEELEAQVAKSKVFNEGVRKPGIPHVDDDSSSKSDSAPAKGGDNGDQGDVVAA
ncbi:MAG: S8 family serine peptidase [Thermoleophilia bacterium]|nr:S8 family serine peptidase [Thermoleophilia bacterium]